MNRSVPTRAAAPPEHPSDLAAAALPGPPRGRRRAVLRLLAAPLLLAVTVASAQLGLPTPWAAKEPAPAASAPTRADLEAELALARAQQARLQSLAQSGAHAPPLLAKQRQGVARWIALLVEQLQAVPTPPAAPLAALPAFGAPPYPATEVDALRDQLDEAQTRVRALLLALDNVESRLTAGLAQRRTADEAERLRREQLVRARDAPAQERLRAELDLARLQVRLAALDLGRADAAREALRVQRVALLEQERALAAEVERVRLQQAVDDAHIDKVAAAAQATRRSLDAERQQLQTQLDRREGEPADDAAPADARARELAARRGQLAALAELDQIEAGRADAWRLRRVALDAIGAADGRDAARARIDRAVEQLALRLQTIDERLRGARAAVRTERLRLESAPTAQGAPAPEPRTLRALQRELDALELVQERLQRLQRLLERSRDDLIAAEQRQPTPLGQRARAALRDGAVAVWRYELFSVTESDQVDGRTVTVEHGVTVGKALGVTLLFVVGWLVARLLSAVLIGVLVRRLQLAPQVGRVLNRWVLAVLLLAVLLVVLELAHIPLTAFASLGGALAIGIGFGTQNIIKNLISGGIILFERKIRVGDIVTIDSVSGTVTSVDLRATTVRGFDGIEAIVPNSQLLENCVSNWSCGSPVIRRSFDTGLRYGDDARAAAAAVLACARADTAVLADPPPEVLFADFGACLLYTSPSPRDRTRSRMPSSA